MSKAADSMLIWKESIYKNGFKCTSCGALLFDTAKDALTEDLAFESVIPGLRLPARCRCGRCGTPAAVAQPNTNGYAPGLGGRLREDGPRREARKTVEVKMYAVGISTEEAYEWIAGKPDDYWKVCREAKANRQRKGGGTVSGIDAPPESGQNPQPPPSGGLSHYRRLDGPGER